MLDMMTQMCTAGWLFGIFALLVLIVLTLAAAALIKYIVTGQRKQAAP